MPLKNKRSKSAKTRNKKAKQKVWYIDLDEYKELAQICEENEWQGRESLPESGSKEAKESGLQVIKLVGKVPMKWTTKEMSLMRKYFRLWPASHLL